MSETPQFVTHVDPMSRGRVHITFAENDHPYVAVQIHLTRLGTDEPAQRNSCI